MPNIVAEEFFNIAVLLRGANGDVLDSRFASDFSRLRCHPLVEMSSRSIACREKASFPISMS